MAKKGGGKRKKKVETVFLVCEETGDYNYTIAAQDGRREAEAEQVQPAAAQAHVARGEEEVVFHKAATAGREFRDRRSRLYGSTSRTSCPNTGGSPRTTRTASRRWSARPGFRRSWPSC